MSRTFQLLLEIQHLNRVLMENRLDFLRTKFVPLIKQYLGTIEDDRTYFDILDSMPDDPDVHTDIGAGLGPEIDDPSPPGRMGGSEFLNKLADKTANAAFEKIVGFDPTVAKKYTQWMLGLFVRGYLPMEDGYKARQYLTLFDRVQKQLPVQNRDINRLQSVHDLFTLIQPYQEAQSQRAVQRGHEADMHSQAKVVFNNERYKIVIPLTMAASCHFGINTQWCTAARDEDDNAFKSYNEDGDLYIILDKKSNKRWQFHMETESFMDENDHPIDRNWFMHEHPELTEFFKQNDEQNFVGKVDDLSVFKTGRGVVLKTNPGLHSELGGFVVTNADNHLTSYRFRGLPDYPNLEQMTAMMNTAGIIGDDKGDNVYDMYYRNGKWGTVATVGEPVVKLNSKLVWKAVDIPARKYGSGNGHSGKVEFQVVDITKPLEQQYTKGETDGVAKAVTLSDEDFWSQNMDDMDSKTFTSTLIPLIKARSDIKFWKPEFQEFQKLTPEGQSWVLKNRPTLCPPAYAYEHLGPTQSVKDICTNYINEAGLRPWAKVKWGFGDMVVITDDRFSLDKDIGVVGAVLHVLGIWNSKADLATMFRKAPYIYHVDDGKLVKGLRKSPYGGDGGDLENTRYVIAMPIEHLVKLLSVPFDDYKGHTWVKFLQIEPKSRRKIK